MFSWNSEYSIILNIFQKLLFYKIFSRRASQTDYIMRRT